MPARTAIERALAMRPQQRRYRPDVAQAANLSGHIELGVGELKAARDQFTRSVEAFQALAIPWGRQFADRDGRGRPRDRRPRRRRNA